MEDFITRNSAEYVELHKTTLQALKSINRLIDELRPSIFNEVYLTGEEVRCMFGISRRSLQTYRDEQIIPTQRSEANFCTRSPGYSACWNVTT